MSNSPIRPIDRTQSSATTPVRVDLRAIAMKGFSSLPKVPALLEPCHLMV